MNIDLLIKMVNEISGFFAGATDAEQAVRDVATHLKRFWEPRMRAQLLRYCDERHGAGLTDLAQRAVALLRTESPAAAASSAAAPPTSRGAGT